MQQLRVYNELHFGGLGDTQGLLAVHLRCEDFKKQ